MSVRIVLNSVWSNPGNRGRRWTRTLRAVEWQLAKRIRQKPRPITLANGARFLAYPDCVVSSSLIYADWPEHKELTFIRRYLNPGDVVIDVGANVGHMSLLLSDIVGVKNLFGFEPAPVSFARLVENWKLNDWPVNQLHRVALGSSVAQMFMRNTVRPLSTNTVQMTRSDQDVAVEVRPLDTFRQLWQGRAIGLLKIDVEGFEAEVLGGSTAVLETDRPKLIMFESLNGALCPVIARVLRETRYEVFELDRTGNPRFGGYTAQNLFAVPAELAVTIN